MEKTSAPHLCVVGHPNRGKSSIVSTLTENDRVLVSPESGTTRSADRFEFRLQGRVMLTLTDTPGFQRARQLLAWLEAKSVSPGDRPQRVREFLAQPEHQSRFPDEVALLTPIMEGAGILYVVDGAQSPSPADEAEMEILRWTGQPRMAIINPMDEQAAVETWQRTLTQFFQWVRVFNPLTAALPARQSLLRALGELAPGWSGPVNQLVELLHQRDRARLAEVSDSLAAYWCEQMTHREEVRLPGESGQREAEARLSRVLDERENQFFQGLKRAWGHTSSAMERQASWELERESLMNTETWYLWGLRQRDLLLVSGSAGAATGLAVDLGLGGTSMFLGAVSGGLLGSVGGWLAARQLPGKRLGWLPLARERRYLGPVRHPNFPLVVMARALTFTRQLWLKPHAERSAIVLNRAEQWQRKEQAQLLNWAKQLQQGRWQAKQQDALLQWVQTQLQNSMEEAVSSEEEKSWRPNM